MIRILIVATWGLLMASCSAKSFDPQARVEIRVSGRDQSITIESLKSFGERHQFEVLASGDMPREGRFVSEVLLQRGDGVMITMDNFLNADVFHVSFYAKKSDADWQSVKAAWVREVRVVLEGRGEISELPIESAPRALNVERKTEEDVDVSE